MAFPNTKLGLVVELALAADLTADPSTWAWTDVTSTYVRVARGVSITRGARDGGLQSPPSTMTFWADNRDGRWVPTNPTGAWYGQIGKGTPIRVRTTEGSSSVRWTGFLTSLPPRWNTKETDRYVEVTASGILQRLERGSVPSRFTYYRSELGADPIDYWPCEDASAATSFASAVTGGRPLGFNSAVTPASESPAAGTDALPSLATGALMNATCRAESTDTWQVRAVWQVPTSPTVETMLFKVITGGTAKVWQLNLVPGSPDSIRLQVLAPDGTSLLNTTSALSADADFYGGPCIVSVSAATDGADLDAMSLVVNASGASVASILTTITGQTVTRPVGIQILADVSLNGSLFGHLATFRETSQTIGLDFGNLTGFDGETVGARVTRLANEVTIIEGATELTGSDDVNTMGPQSQQALLGLLRECEAVNGGRLIELRDAATDDFFLELICADDISNQAAALTLNHDSGHLAPPFEPTDDDQHLINDVTATRSGGSGIGSSARVVATAGEHSASLTPAKVGTYADSVSVNVELDELLIHQAGWRVNVGTVEGLRFPVVTLNFAHNPSLIADWIGCDIGSRITITNPPAGIAPDSIDLLVEGWTEIFGPYTWEVQLNCLPYKPWHVFRLAETSADTNVFLGRLAGDEKCALRTAVDDNDTSFVVDPNFFRWTTTADDFPVNIRLGGEVCTVSAISTTAATYVGRGALSSADNAAVTPATTGFGAADGDLLLCLARMRGTAGSLSTASTGWELMAQVGNLYLYGAIRSGSTAITVTPSGGAAGDVVSATVFAFTGMPTTLDALADMIVQIVKQSNASAQDIAFPGMYPTMPGQIVLLLAGKSDDWTSVAVPAGYTESGEPSTGTGSDQGLYIAYQIQTTPVVVNGGSLVVTGGAAAVSESMALVLGAGFQTFTISARNVNGITGGKSQTAGTLIEVDDPARLAL